MAKSKDYLVLFPEVAQACAMLSDAQFGQLMRAAFGYRFTGTPYGGGDMAVSIAFSFVSTQIDRAVENSEEMSRRASARWERQNGKSSAPQPPKNDAETQEEEKGMHSNAQHTPAQNSDAPIHSNPIHSNPIHSSEDIGAEGSAPAAIVLLPLNDGTEYAVTQRMVDEWAAAYQAVDVPEQLKRMRAWLLSNPKKRKTARGILAFCNSWLSGEQDHPPRGRAAPAGGKQKVEYGGNGIGDFERETIRRNLLEMQSGGGGAG